VPLPVTVQLEAVTVKFSELLLVPPTVIIMLAAPADRVLGTVAVMDASDQEATVAVVPPKVTVLVPCDVPKFVPVIVMAVLTTAEVGLTEVMDGTAAVVDVTVSAMVAI
jgi:hypothetical protein